MGNINILARHRGDVEFYNTLNKRFNSRLLAKRCGTVYS